MSDRPTPETDYEEEIDNGDTVPLFKFARNLERQRDEARDQLTQICREGFGYQDTISLEPCADYVLRKLKEEREELLKLRVENDHNWQAVAEANPESENDTQSELAAWELLKQTRELARELRDALKELADNGHTEECDKVNYANKHCDCGVDSARILISKAKEVLP